MARRRSIGGQLISAGLRNSRKKALAEERDRQYIEEEKQAVDAANLFIDRIKEVGNKTDLAKVRSALDKYEDKKKMLHEVHKGLWLVPKIQLRNEARKMARVIEKIYDKL